jgi:hypothetical protein
MPILRKCKTCSSSFYAKPFHVKKGQGIYCSQKCHFKDKKGRVIECGICKKEVYRTSKLLEKSKSGKSFCGKSCQTIWRNKVFSGSRHKMWKGGFSMYRDILIKNSQKIECLLCKERDIRVLAVHHIDKNIQNNEINNLSWLCHNCHYLVHNHEGEKLKFELLLKN